MQNGVAKATPFSLALGRGESLVFLAGDFLARL
jgi:hypothetical protein